MKIIDYEFPYMVDIGEIPSHFTIYKLIRWADNNITFCGYRHSYTIYGKVKFHFKYKEDAVAFELAWC